MPRYLAFRSSIRVILAALLCVLHSPDAAAKPVKVGWKEIQGATQYELEIRNNAGKVVTKKKGADNSWKGDLPPGFYSYQIRAYDWMKRAGKWSNYLPLIVMASEPELTSPDSNSVLETYYSFTNTKIRWTPTRADKYLVEVRRDQKVVFQTETAKTEIHLPRLEAGKYTWSVRAAIEASDKAPAEFRGKKWESKEDSSSRFTVRQRILEAPKARAPSGTIEPPAEGMVRFEWEKVEGATAYEITLTGIDGDRRKPANETFKKTQNLKQTSILMKIPGDGSYTWKVRALASSEKTKETASSLETKSEFLVDRDAVFLKGTGYIALSTMIAPYNYVAISPSANQQISASSAALTLRLSGEYWFLSRLGAFAGAESTFFTMNRSSFQRGNYELGVKYRLKIDEARFGWFIAPKAGLELRDYFELLPTGSGSTSLQSTLFRSLGPTVGVDIRKQFSERWSVGAKASYYLPVALLSSSATITADDSRRNINVGIQGLYWIFKNWSLGAGIFIDKRSISVLPPSASRPEEVFMDGTYFFGSVIYSFGQP